MQHISYLNSEDSDGGRLDEEAKAVERLIRRRRNSRTHVAFGVAAGVLGAVALCVWATVRADVAHGPDAPLSTTYAAYLAFAIVLGFAAFASAFTWLIVWNTNARVAEADRIREYHQARQVRVIQEAIGVFLRDGDRDTQGALRAVQSLINRSDTGTVTPFPRAHL